MTDTEIGALRNYLGDDEGAQGPATQPAKYEPTIFEKMQAETIKSRSPFFGDDDIREMQRKQRLLGAQYHASQAKVQVAQQKYDLGLQSIMSGVQQVKDARQQPSVMGHLGRTFVSGVVDPTLQLVRGTMNLGVSFAQAFNDFVSGEDTTKGTEDARKAISYISTPGIKALGSPPVIQAIGQELFGVATTGPQKSIAASLDERIAENDRLEKEYLSSSWSLRVGSQIVGGAGHLIGFMVGAPGKLINAMAAPLTPIATRIIGSAATRLGLKAGASASELAAAEAAGVLAPYVESLLSGGQKVSLAITKWLAKSGTVIPGFAAEGALANEGEMKERAKEGAVAALMAPIYVGVGMLSEALAGSLVKPVADRALITRWLGGQEGWNPRIASAVGGAVEGLGFSAADVEFWKDGWKGFVNGDSEAIDTWLGKTLGSVAGMAAIKGVRPGQHSLYNRDNYPVIDAAIEQLAKDLEKSAPKEDAPKAEAPEADKKVGVPELFRNLGNLGWRAIPASEGKTKIKLPGFPGEILFGSRDGEPYLKMDAESKRSLHGKEEIKGQEEVLLTLEDIAIKTAMSNAEGRMFYPPESGEPDISGVLTIPGKRVAYRFGRVFEQDTSREGLPWTLRAETPFRQESVSPNEMLAFDRQVGDSLEWMSDFHKLMTYQTKAAREGRPLTEWELRSFRNMGRIVDIIKNMSRKEAISNPAVLNVIELMSDPAIRDILKGSTVPPEERIRSVNRWMAYTAAGASSPKRAVAEIAKEVGKREAAKDTSARSTDAGARQGEGIGVVDKAPRGESQPGSADRGSDSQARGEGREGRDLAPSKRRGTERTIDSDLPPGKFLTRKSTVIRALEKLIGSRIHVAGGFMAKSDALGMYREAPGDVMTNAANEIEVAAHEAGHKLHKLLEKDMNKSFSPKIDAELDKIGREIYGDKVPDRKHFRAEGVADFVARDMINDPADNVRAQYPEFAKYLDAKLDANKGLRKKYDAAKEQFRLWDKQGASGRVASFSWNQDDPDFHTREKADSKLGNVIQKYRETMIDRLSKGTDKEKEFWKAQGIDFDNVPQSKSPFKTAALFNMNAHGQALNALMNRVTTMFGEGRGKGLEQIFSEYISRDELKAWVTYANARRMLGESYLEHTTTKVEKDAAGNDVEKTVATPREPGLSRADLEDAVKKLETPAFKRLLKKYTGWYHSLLAVKYEAGQWTKEEFERLLKSDPQYHLFQRMFDPNIELAGQEDKGLSWSKGFLSQAKDVKNVEGSTRELKDALQVAFEFAHQVYTDAAKLLVQKSLYEMVRDSKGNPLEGSEGWIREVPVKEANNANIIHIKIKGEDKYLWVNSDMLQALSNMDKANIHSALAFAKFASASVRTIATGLSVPFVGAQMVLDAFQSFASSRVGNGYFAKLLPRANTIVGFIDLMANWVKSQGDKSTTMTGLGSAAQQFRSMGGDASTWVGDLWRDSTAVVDKIVKPSIAFKTARLITKPGLAVKEALKSVRTSLERVLSAQNLMARIGEFKGMKSTLREKHPDWSEQDIAAEAFLAARDLTIDFARQGVIAAKINHYNAFFSSAMGGASKGYRDYLSNEHGWEQTAANWTRAAGAVGGLTMLFYWLNKDRKWYNSLTNRERDDYWFVGDDEKPWFKFPKPQGIIGALFGKITEGVAAIFHQKHPEQMEEAVWSLIQNAVPIMPWVPSENGIKFNSRLIPNIATPFMEVGMNVDFLTGRPIVNEYQDRLNVPEKQHNKDTPEIAKWIGQAVGISPEKVEIFLRDTAGGVGLDAARFWDAINGATEGKIDRYPLIQRFLVRDLIGKSSEVNDLYNTEKTLGQKHGSKLATHDEERILRRARLDKERVSDIRRRMEAGRMPDAEAYQRIQDIADRFVMWKQGLEEK